MDAKFVPTKHFYYLIISVFIYGGFAICQKVILSRQVIILSEQEKTAMFFVIISAFVRILSPYNICPKNT
jgi:hypothetical protein